MSLSLAQIPEYNPLPYPDPRGITLENHRQLLPNELQVECTTDMQYLHQYFYIREYIYRTDLKVASFDGEEDETDRRSHLIIARIGHFCVGGLRLTISHADRPAKLTLERGGFDIHDHVAGLKNTSYCDLGRVAVLPAYRHTGALQKMFELAVRVAQNNGCTLLFGASPPAQARLFQRVFRRLGYKDDLHPEVPVPTGQENQHLRLIFKIIYI